MTGLSTWVAHVGRLDQAIWLRAWSRRFAVTTEAHAQERNDRSDRHRQRPQPKHRLSREIVASMPARKCLSVPDLGLATSHLLDGDALALLNTTSRTPSFLMSSRLARDVKPPSKETWAGGGRTTLDGA